MNDEQLEQVEKIARQLGGAPSCDGEAMKFSLPAADGLACEFTLPRGLREWFITLRDGDGRELVNHWVDHYALDGESEAELGREMLLEVVRVMELVAGARFVTEGDNEQLAILVDGVSVALF